MPFHHVTAGLLYKGNNYLNRSLSTGSDSEQLANISVEELDGKVHIVYGTSIPKKKNHMQCTFLRYYLQNELIFLVIGTCILIQRFLPLINAVCIEI